MTGEPMDWEAAMRDTRSSAERAARHSERTLGGVAEVMARQAETGARISEMTKRLDSLQRQLSLLIEERKESPATDFRPSPHDPEPAPRRCFLLWWAMPIVLAVSAGYFWNS